MSEVAYVNKIIKFSSVDGPGNRTAVFLQGCNFNCLYCHNPETINHCIHCGACIDQCPVKALERAAHEIIWHETLCVNCDNCLRTCPHDSSPKIKMMSAETVMDFIGSARHFIRGITVSGGECMLQHNFIRRLFSLAKTKKLSTFIDSNGSADFTEVPELIGVTDAVMLDVKAFDRAEHIKVTGVSNEIVLKNLHFLASANKLFEIRTVIVPGLFNVEQTIKECSKIIRPYASVRYKIIKYRPLGVRQEYQQYPIPSQELLDHLRQTALDQGVKNVVIV